MMHPSLIQDRARDVADLFPSALVQGVDLSPVPNVWVPPNCKFEVDDILKPWDFQENGRFDLVHLSALLRLFKAASFVLTLLQDTCLVLSRMNSGDFCISKHTKISPLGDG